MSETPEYIKEFDAMRDRVIRKWPNVSPERADEIADFALKVKREAYEDAARVCHEYAERARADRAKADEGMHTVSGDHHHTRLIAAQELEQAIRASAEAQKGEG